MQTQLVLVFLLVTHVCSSVLFHQPTARTHKRQNFGDESLIEEVESSGPSPPRTADVPPVSGFNFDQFAADDFINDEIWAIDVIDVKIAVNQLDDYDINRVFIAIYPDEGRGLPDYNPYDFLNPEPVWYSFYDWESDDPETEYSAPWLDNPVRAGAVIVNTTDQIDLIPGHYWLTLHFEILTSDISVPPAVWLPGDTDLFLHDTARLYVPGNNPSSGSVNAFGWFWNDLVNFGVGALAFSLEGRSTDFIMDVEKFPVACPGEDVSITATLSFLTEGEDLDVEVELDFPPEITLTADQTTLNAGTSTTTILASGMTAGNEYTVTLTFTSPRGLSWTDTQTIRAVSDVLEVPEIIIRDDYGLVGGLFQWRPTSFPENYQIQIVPEEGNFSDAEFDVLTPGDDAFYRTILTDWEEGGAVNNFDARDQARYTMRIRSVNPSCGTEPSDWEELFFTSDSCELFAVTLPDGTYNFQKNKFVVSSHTVRDFGVITDVRLLINGFHQQWSDAAIAIGTPVDFLGTTIDLPQYSDGCEEDFDSGDFEIRFAVGTSRDPEEMCPPPHESEDYNMTLIDPIGGYIFEQFVRGQEKKGTWSVEWLDRGIGFPTNGKIESYDLLICAVPVPAREHIVYGGESKVRRGTTAVYGS